MKAVLFYEVAADGLLKARTHFPAHRAFMEPFHARGELLMIGTFANPADGSLAVFRDRAAAEAFAAGDPFVREGVVGKWRIMDWNEALVP